MWDGSRLALVVLSACHASGSGCCGAMHGSLRRTFIPRGVWQPMALLTPEITGTTDRIQSTPCVSMCDRSLFAVVRWPSECSCGGRDTRSALFCMCMFLRSTSMPLKIKMEWTCVHIRQIVVGLCSRLRLGSGHTKYRGRHGDESCRFDN